MQMYYRCAEVQRDAQVYINCNRFLHELRRYWLKHRITIDELIRLRKMALEGNMEEAVKEFARIAQQTYEV